MKRSWWLLVLALLAGLLGPVPSAVALAPRPLADPAAAGTISIVGATNFRDVAGDGLAVKGGAHMATGVVYRSSKLSGLTADDVAALEAAGVTAILDLRTPRVAAGSPDVAVPGAGYVLMDLFAGHSLSTSRLHTAAQARAHMREMNRRFVTVAAQRRALARVLRAIIAADGPVVIHCTHGKDRTGWVSAMLQVVAGAPTDTIVAQYLLSNTYRAAEIQQKVDAARAASGSRRAGVVKELERLRASYLEAGLATARHRYGSVHRYLTRGVGLSTDELAALRAKLVVG